MMSNNHSTNKNWGELKFLNRKHCEKVRFPIVDEDSIKLENNKYIIGRSRDCDIQLGIKMISGHHCTVTRDGSKAYLTDTSVNGTFINKNIRVNNGMVHELSNKDEIYIIHKKNDPKSDFCFIFLSKLHEVDQDLTNSTSSQTVLSPFVKHVKKEPIDETYATVSSARDAGEEPPAKRQMLTINGEIEPGDQNFQETEANCSEDNPGYSGETEEEVLDPLLHMSQTAQMVKSPKLENVEESENMDPTEEGFQDTPSPDSFQNPNSTNYPESMKDSSDLKEPEEILPNTSESSPSPKVEQEQESVDRDPVEERLQCSLCLDILHNPVSLHPCQHCYCAGCYSNWMSQSSQCPECRKPTDSATRNHFVRNLVEAYFKTHPDKRRSTKDIEKLDSEDVIDGNTVSFRPVDGGAHHSGNPSSIPSSQRLVCQQCPKKGATASDSVDSEAKKQNPFQCTETQQHLQCRCCNTPMPDRRAQVHLGVPPQECTVCRNVYCSMYWTCQVNTCIPCLTKFRDFSPQPFEVINILIGNVVESQILTNYLNHNQLTWVDVIAECMQILQSGQSSCTLQPESAVCHTCALHQIKTLIYDYRSRIPADRIPASGPARPDCYWGHECRTQRHKMSHAQKYNHICHRTRF